MITSSRRFAGAPERSRAARTANAPSSVAENDASAPRNRPVGVRTALTITGSRSATIGLLHVLLRSQAHVAGRERGRLWPRFLQALYRSATRKGNHRGTPAAGAATCLVAPLP